MAPRPVTLIQREPVNFKLVIEAPSVEPEVFREWLDSLSTEERAALTRAG